ncbi:MAG: hypothetical protein ACRDRZ_03715 [Pseudonocardiaceae bacterium]
MTSTEGKEFAITTSSADNHPEACPCGALADRNSLCRKCRARATWNRRAANRERRARRHPSSSPRTSRDSKGPHGRRPGHGH